MVLFVVLAMHIPYFYIKYNIPVADDVWLVLFVLEVSVESGLESYDVSVSMIFH